VAKTTTDCHSELVLHSLRNNQPVQVVVHQLRQTTLVFPVPCDQTCRSISIFRTCCNLVYGVGTRCRECQWLDKALFDTPFSAETSRCLRRPVWCEVSVGTVAKNTVSGLTVLLSSQIASSNFCRPHVAQGSSLKEL